MSPKMTNSNFILPPLGGKTLRGFPAGKIFDRLRSDLFLLNRFDYKNLYSQPLNAD